MPETEGPVKDLGCERCWPTAADAAWEARAGLDTVTDLIDESHYGVTILACPQCKQRFVLVFTETIDWAGGDDPQYTNLLPVTEAEVADLQRQRDALPETALSALGPGRRCLQRRYPSDERSPRNSWRTGVSVGPHD